MVKKTAKKKKAANDDDGGGVKRRGRATAVGLVVAGHVGVAKRPARGAAAEEEEANDGGGPAPARAMPTRPGARPRRRRRRSSRGGQAEEAAEPSSSDQQPPTYVESLAKSARGSADANSQGRRPGTAAGEGPRRAKPPSPRERRAGDAPPPSAESSEAASLDGSSSSGERAGGAGSGTRPRPPCADHEADAEPAESAEGEVEVVGESNGRNIADDAASRGASTPSGKECRFDGCEKSYEQTDGYCKQHLKTVEPESYDPQRGRECKTKGCDKYGRKAGYCAACFVINNAAGGGEEDGSGEDKEDDVGGGDAAGEASDVHDSTNVQLQAEHFSEGKESSSSSSQDGGDGSRRYPDSCIVRVPRDASSGDRLTVRWPTRGRRSRAAGKRKRADEVPSDDKPHERSRPDGEDEEEPPDLLVRITLPSKLKSGKRNGEPRHVRVFAPWAACDRAASASLTSRQLRSIGFDHVASTGRHGAANLRRSRRQQIRNHGEGSFSVGHSRIGERYQVSSACIPRADEWETERIKATAVGREGTGAAECDWMWDRALAEEANEKGKDMDRYVESLRPYRRARGVLALHRCNYDTSAAERQFDDETRADVPFPDRPEPANRPCRKPHALLEGKPLSPTEHAAFNEAIQEHRKQWPKIASAVGTSLNRCLIHYYSTYKAGEGREEYLRHKKRWEQSDLCEVCNDGGDLLCCDGCINAYHLECTVPPLKEVPVGQWFCAECLKKKGAK